ncbi:MAG: Gfo/Idh/MocA family oxidoreductase [Gemmatimonadaceae bacterium]|nr:Gfo/Idh/MocA family oxidoreductase [Acetobacteraceae bacterium]
MVNSTVNWGIAGCGWVARDYVGPAIQASRNGRIAALFDTADASRTQAAALFGGTAHADLGAFLATPGLGAVYVASPNHVHRSLVEAAAAAGLPVLCEKPMATTLPDAEAMVAACDHAGVLYATAFDQRFHAAHQMLAAMVADGRLGTVTAIRIVYACWLPADWPTGAGDNWRIDPARAGGGALMDLAPHGLDLSSFILDEPLVEIAAIGQARVHKYGVEDGALLMARSRSGAMVQMHVAYNCPETLPRRRLEVVGTAGQAIATDTMGQTAGGTLDWIDAATGVSAPIDVPGADRSPFLNQVEAFADAVLGQRPFGFPGAQDLAIMDLVLRAQAMAKPPGTSP